MSSSRLIKGVDIVTGTRIKTWFMLEGTAVICIAPYNGPLAYLFDGGARIITFNAATRSGSMSMTVGNNEWLELSA